MDSCYLCRENGRCEFYHGLSLCLGGTYSDDAERTFISRFVACRCAFHIRKGWRVRPDLFKKKKGYWFYNFIHYITYYIIGLCEWLQLKSYKFHKGK